jgi:hypothetical protein
MRLKNYIRLRLFLLNSLGIIKTVILLIVPAFFATANVWLNWIVLKLPIDFSNWITTSYDSLVSIFGVLAGAYLTLYATYTLKMREERQKSIASKELTFYTPMLNEIIAAIEYYKSKNIWRFSLEGHGWGISWRFWNETQTSLLKYNVPKIFTDKIAALDSYIKMYMEKYNEVSTYCTNTALNMNKEAGLVDKVFLGAYSGILEDIYLNRFSEESVKNSVPNIKDIDIDCEKLSQDIVHTIINSEGYKEIIYMSDKLNGLIYEVYDGIDYILMRIYKKYKGMNILL